MIIAIDTNCILPGRVGGIEQYTLTLIRCLLSDAAWLDRLILLTRPENHELFRTFVGPRCRLLLIPRPNLNGKPITNWADARRSAPAATERALHQYQTLKTKLIEETGASLVHFPGNTINPLDLPLPAVLNLHDLQHRHFPRYFTSAELENRQTWWTASAQRAQSIIVSSRFIADQLSRELATPLRKIAVAPLPVDTFFLRETTRILSTPSSPLFLYPASFWPHKNHARLVRAFVDAKLPNAQLILTGFEPNEPGVSEMLSGARATDAVHILGRVSRQTLRQLYQQSTALILPSEYEASSLPVIEAMAAGCPVAASSIPSLVELIGDAGLLFDPHDESSMTEAMRRLANDPPLRHDLIGRARERVLRFTPQRYLQGLKSAYDLALAANRESLAA